MIPEISVVIGTLNQRSALVPALTAYRDQTISTFELIVVDSGSTDGAWEWLTSTNFEFELRPIQVENRGKAAARNHGIKMARAPIIVITDADMIPDSTMLECHRDAHRKMPLTCFEGLEYNMDRLVLPPTDAVLTPYIRPKYRNNSRLGWWYFLTGNLSIPRSVLDKWGGFSEDFTGYGWEDLELGYRYHLAKIPLRYLKGAVNYHYHVVAKDSDIRRNYEKGRSAQLMLAKHPELKWFLGLHPANLGIYHVIKQVAWIRNLVARFGVQKVMGEVNYLAGLLGDSIQY